jgi:hypothetical protein
MYFNIDGRDEKYYHELKMFIEYEYRLNILSMKEHNRGWYGETWKIECDGNRGFFVKIVYYDKHAKKYQQCFPVLNFMRSRGIDFVSEVITARNGKPFLIFNGGTLAVFKFVDGVHIEDTPTTLVPLMVNIYKLPKPDFQIEREDFVTDVFRYLENQMAELRHSDDVIFEIVKSNWELLIDADKQRKRFSEICIQKSNVFVITSGDIGGNIMVHDGRYTIIDWDWVKLAPPERDFWWYIQFPEQIAEINASFKREGFDYVMDTDLISYYAFYSYIYYLTEYIDCLLFNPASRPEIIQRFKEHFDENDFFRKNLRNAICLTGL